MRNTIAFCLALWTTQTASAWYDPGIQRWLNRDPLGEPGFEAVTTTRSPLTTVHSSVGFAELLEGPDLYTFVRNKSTILYDADGLFDVSQECAFARLMARASGYAARQHPGNKYLWALYSAALANQVTACGPGPDQMKPLMPGWPIECPSNWGRPKPVVPPWGNPWNYTPLPWWELYPVYVF